MKNLATQRRDSQSDDAGFLQPKLHRPAEQQQVVSTEGTITIHDSETAVPRTQLIMNKNIQIKDKLLLASKFSKSKGDKNFIY